jgi:hypothetical protein
MKIDGNKSEQFETFQGVRKGRTLLPLLFNTVTDEIENIVQKEGGKNSNPWCSIYA